MNVYRTEGSYNSQNDIATIISNSTYIQKYLVQKNKRIQVSFMIYKTCKKVKISLLQAVEAHRVAGGQGSHIT
jgi:hypothetical protein